MKIQDVIDKINSTPNEKLEVVSIIYMIRGGGLFKSKVIADTYFIYGGKQNGETIINYLSNTDEWSNIKKNIRKLKEL